MSDFEIIDFHLHLCRDMAQEKLVFPHPGWPDEWYWCNPERIGSYIEARSISNVVTLNIMDTGRMTEARLARLPRSTSEDEVAQRRTSLADEMRDRVRKFNTWACETRRDNPRIVSFVMIDPVLFGAESIVELERCLALGACGVKVHPDICRHFPEHPDLMPVFERLQQAKLPVLTDTVGRPHADGNTYGRPANWAPVLSEFPRLTLIMAHFCDEMWDDRIEMARQFRDNLWFDMSGGLIDPRHPQSLHRDMPASQAVRVFRKLGVERMLFGSDGPGTGGLEPQDAASQLLALPFTVEEKRLMLAENARRLLGSCGVALAP
ncbi:MAG: hypothetical protein EXR51_04950 [Dehalococcoidia bacterium]|nr:hypothetical protein [Dehalococcoidia bacterium]